MIYPIYMHGMASVLVPSAIQEALSPNETGFAKTL